MVSLDSLESEDRKKCIWGREGEEIEFCRSVEECLPIINGLVGSVPSTAKPAEIKRGVCHACNQYLEIEMGESVGQCYLN